jgi:RepB DNA-primase from phage plasmid
MLNFRTGNRQREKHGGGMDGRAGNITTAAAKALVMLAAFASVGACAFNLTLTGIDGEKIPGGYRPNRGLEEMRRTISRILADAARARHNVIIRPRSSSATLIQLDDLDFAKAMRIAPRAFLVFQTSPANYQAWVAVEAGAPADFARRLRKGIGSDLTASGSTRIAGSLNVKPKYAPAFPMVEITQARPGNLTSMAALEQGGFVARPEEPRRAQHREPARSSGRWPSYELCIKGAPPAQGDPDRPDVSRADFTWCRTAYQWGHGVEAIAARLADLSSAARKDGPRYVQLTATRAAASVDRERQGLKSTLRPA